MASLNKTGFGCSWAWALGTLILTACGGVTDISPSASDGNLTNACLCDGTAPTAIFLMAGQQQLFEFDPVHGTFTRGATLDCGARGYPVSEFALSHDGTGYALIGGPVNRAMMCQFDVRTGRGQARAYYPGQQGLEQLFFTFVPDPQSGSETLYAFASRTNGTSGISALAVDTMRHSELRALDHDVRLARITADDLGKLYVFEQNERAMTINEIDVTDLKTRDVHALELPADSNTFPIAWWQDQLFVFLGDGAYRVDPTSFELHLVANIGGQHYQNIVAASAPHCNVGRVASDEAQRPPDLRACLASRGADYFREGHPAQNSANAYGYTPNDRFSEACTGYGFSTECAMYESCTVSCQNDVNCPQAFGAKNQAVCGAGRAGTKASGQSACILPCQTDDECPRDMRCISDGMFGSACLWEYPFKR